MTAPAIRPYWTITRVLFLVLLLVPLLVPISVLLLVLFTVLVPLLIPVQQDSALVTLLVLLLVLGFIECLVVLYLGIGEWWTAPMEWMEMYDAEKTRAEKAEHRVKFLEGVTPDVVSSLRKENESLKSRAEKAEAEVERLGKESHP